MCRPDRRQVPLSEVARFVTKTEPVTVNHQGVFPAVTLSFNLANGRGVEPGGDGDRPDAEQGRRAGRR